MSYVTVGAENGSGVDIYYEDHGTGRPVVLVHGYPLNGHSWERQERVLLAAGYRVITYDRRGFGQSAKPAAGFDYDTFAADPERPARAPGPHRRGAWRVLDGHRRSDPVPEQVRVGPGRQGGDGRSDTAVRAQDGGQPRRRRRAGVRGHQGGDRQGPLRYFGDFFDNFYNTDTFSPDRISGRAWEASFQVAAASSPVATYLCVDSWLTDFRDDLPKIDVPTLVIHGTADRILPYEATAKRLPGLIKDLQLVAVEGGPHNICWTHSDEVNATLLAFLAD